MSNISKYFKFTDIVVTSPNTRYYLEFTNIVGTGPQYVNIKSHGYCSDRFNICKYLEFVDSVVIDPKIR